MDSTGVNTVALGSDQEPSNASPELRELGDGGPLPVDALMPAHKRFERTARRQPEKTAVVSRQGMLSYAELDSRATAVATHLRGLGVGREDIVAICLPHRLDALIAIYGVLKAGAAYLPMHVSQPLARRRFMLEDTAASALITIPAWKDDLAANSAQVLLWEEQRPARTSRQPTGEPPQPGLDDLAYVIYTSGSTGQPKGVMIEHRSLAAYVHWGLTAFSADELARVFAATSFTFDMSLYELTVPFAAGGTLVLADNFAEIAKAHDQGLTLVNTVPSLMAAFLEHGSLPPSVETAVFCGETLPQDVAAKVHRQAGVRRVVNAYGPTEDTVYSTATDVQPGDRPTCGRPLAGTQVYLLDSDLKMVPRGEAGEICLGGVGLARGYLGREDLTRERFVQYPFGPSGPPRVYRTGDLGRWEADGSLQHLGRIDDQIKLHGVRIEPGEIEDALVRHPDVDRAAVALRERTTGGKSLVGYVVRKPGRDPSTGALRDALRKTLPEPMVPSTFIKLEELPLNSNGKLDRSRLPAPQALVSDSGPLSQDERDLAEIWRDLLNLQDIPGPDDDFFDLGGDSLLAFQLFDRITARFGTELPPSLLVQASTLRALALWIDAAEFVEGRVVVEFHVDGTKTPCFYVQSGAGGILTLRNFASAFGADQPLYGIQAFRDDDVEAGQILSVASTAADCLPIVRQRQPRGPYFIAGHSIGGHIAFELACLLEAEGEAVAYLGLLDPPAPHTLRPVGRIAGRAREAIGIGPEERRAHPVHAAVSKARRRLRWQMPSHAGDGSNNDADRPSQWMRNLEAMEKRFRPSRLHGQAVVYRSREMGRLTGSPTLGWDRYVRGEIQGRSVPGGHVSLLLDPHVHVVAEEMAADLRAAQAAISAPGREPLVSGS